MLVVAWSALPCCCVDGQKTMLKRIEVGLDWLCPVCSLLALLLCYFAPLFLCSCHFRYAKTPRHLSKKTSSIILSLSDIQQESQTWGGKRYVGMQWVAMASE